MRPYRILHFVISWPVGLAFFQEQQKTCLFNAVSKRKNSGKWSEGDNEVNQAIRVFWLSILIYIWVKLEAIVGFWADKTIFLIHINTDCLNFLQFTQALSTPVSRWQADNQRNCLKIWGRERATCISLILNINTLIQYSGG